jgi:flavin reductase (DIM6/NTAB) family NADH-FMN oxidoreductase RutF
MFYETARRNHGLPHDPVKALVAPRPIGWVTTMSAQGEINLSPYSFFNMIAERPQMVAFSSVGYKDAVAFIDETHEFVWNLATFDLREAMNVTSAPFARGDNEMIRAQLEPAPARLVRPPRVARSPAALECKHVRTIQLETRDGRAMDQYLVIGEVVGVHIEDRFIVDGLVDTGAMRPIMRAGYHDYFVATPETKFSLRRPTTA